MASLEYSGTRLDTEAVASARRQSSGLGVERVHRLQDASPAGARSIGADRGAVLLRGIVVRAWTRIGEARSIFRGTSVIHVVVLLVALCACGGGSMNAPHVPHSDEPRSWFDARVRSCVPELNAPRMQARLHDIRQRLQARAGLSRPVLFSVLEDHRPQAYALLSDSVYISVGLAMRLDTEDQLAAILAYGMAHALRARSQIPVAPMLVPSEPSREHEVLDDLAVRLLVESGYEPSGLHAVLTLLERIYPAAGLHRRIDRLAHLAEPQIPEPEYAALLDELTFSHRGPALGGDGWGLRMRPPRSPCEPFVLIRGEEILLEVFPPTEATFTPTPAEALPNGFSVRVESIDDRHVRARLLHEETERIVRFVPWSGPSTEEALRNALVSVFVGEEAAWVLRIAVAREGETAIDACSRICQNLNPAMLQGLNLVMPDEPLQSGHIVRCADRGGE